MYFTSCTLWRIEHAVGLLLNIGGLHGRQKDRQTFGFYFNDRVYVNIFCHAVAYLVCAVEQTVL